ncbi:MAG TPA: S41 family peptidase [Caulobacteraceae bacterium]|nr:S41 family peptidase [Caulobacteraceae bacterium]
MSKSFTAFAALCAAVLAASAGSAQEPRSKAPLAEPSLSPDGSEIAFASGGDIWTVPAQGGVARLLVTDPATESRPLWSPDGSRLAFASNRGGTTNIYVLTLATGRVERLTWGDVNEQLDGWSRDGKWIYFTSGINDVTRLGDVFRVSSSGGTPLEVSRERYLNEFQSAPSPDGKTVALAAKGISSGQWWRNGSSHIDQSELWLKPIADGAPHKRLMASGARHAWPMWSKDGGALFFMSDRGGSENLWRLPLNGGEPQQLTKFDSGRVLWPSIGGPSDEIVFERGFGIWRFDPKTGRASEVPITLRGSPAGAGERRLSETSFQELGLSPDGKKVAVTARGEVFAASAEDGGTAQRVSRTPTAEAQPVWSPDSRRLLYVAERGLDSQLVEYDVATETERTLTSGQGRVEAPSWSPDGKMIAYFRAPREMRVITLGDDRKVLSDTVVFTGAYGSTEPSWSPDGRWIAFSVIDRKSFTNIHVVPATGGEARPISFLANGDTGRRVAWSPDGKYVLFSSAHRSEPSQMIRVDLLPNVPKFREDAFREMFKATESTPDKPNPSPTTPPGETKAEDEAAAPAELPAAAPAKGKAAAGAKAKTTSVKIVFEGIRERATILPLGMSADDPAISPDGKTLVFSGSSGSGPANLYSYNLDELAKEPPFPQALTSSRRPKGDYAFTPDSKKIFFLEAGAVTSTPIESPKAKVTAVTAEMEVDFDVEKRVVFDQAWGTLNRRFYDPNFHGRDWNAARGATAPYVEGARTPDEMRRVINLMIGELNASHSGLNRSPELNPAPRVGDLGLRFDREAYEAGRGLAVREVIRLGPADLEGSIKVGDVLLAVDGTAIGRTANLDQLLQGKIGRRTVLRVAPGGDAAKARNVVVRPIGGAVATGLLYRQWVNDRRAYVNRISGGKLGYVHIPDMGDQSLAQLYVDLDAENQGKQGVVIDIRNNNGGYVHGRVLDVFSRKTILTMTPRDLFGLPSRQALGQRAFDSPTVLVTNESSLSDAEDFTEGYKLLGLGQVVGTPTSGWIIYTSGQPLIDGSILRVPFIKIEDTKGQNMELNPRPVDIRVERPLGETLTGRDAQLEAAVQELLKRVQ